MRIALLIAFTLFALRRLLTYLHIFQQEEYDGRRFVRWLVAQRAYDIRTTLFLAALGGVEAFRLVSQQIATGLGALWLLLFFVLERDPRKRGKKKLNMTGRAKRIYWTAVAITFGVALFYAWLSPVLILWIIPVQFIPFALIVGNWVTKPYENKIQQRFWNEAHRKLLTLKPTIIGITGSFGKTSTKHLLGHILEVQARTLITPGSVNTPMGVARIIREQLGGHHRFFVCEMGAYGPGSIARLCRLAPPNVGVITAVGMAHYERFKTLDAVAQTKFELAYAAAKANGPAIVAEQAMAFEPAREFAAAYPNNLIVVGSGANCTFRISNSALTASGIEAEVIWKGQTYLVRAPLFGEHHVSNMMLSFAAACAIGIAPEDAIVALASVPQIKHRLEVKDLANGARVVDDAYNSNPVGFASALHVLTTLRNGHGRRIVVTPGMVELGDAHDNEHTRIGAVAGQNADVLLPVLPSRIPTFVAAFLETNPNGTVVPCNTFTEAQEWMDANLRSGDVVLLENDLPDLYEKKLLL